MLLFTEISGQEIFTVIALAVFLFVIGPLWFVWYRKQENPNSLARMLFVCWIIIYVLFGLAGINAMLNPS